MKLLHHSLPLLAITLLVASSTFAQETPAKPAKPASKEELIKKLTNTLTGAKLTGKFTILGKEDADPKTEEYTILSATKTDEGDIWLLKARIKYGNKDVTLPVPLEIQWAGETPIITMTDMGIPGLGEKFSTRVVIYDGLYAGTWAHGPVKGHMFGTIKKD
jgi:hypothetical protein